MRGDVGTMPPIPLRMIFRNRWAALAWAGGICLMAGSFASSDVATVDTANAADSNLAQLSALAAEDD